MEKVPAQGKRAFGADQEERASRYLEMKGLRLVERNYHCRLGEIDLIMLDGEQLVFVEVRFRQNFAFGSPLETVDQRKQRKLILCAQHYLMRRKLTERISCRFDVLGISLRAHGGDAFAWIPNAFGV